MTQDVTIRIHTRAEKGEWQDDAQDYGLSDFGGFLPAVGDFILEPGVGSNLDRTDPKNRVMMKVVERVFNPRDLSDYVLLIVDKRALTETQRAAC